MHAITISDRLDESVPILSSTRKLNPGETYICSNGFAASLMLSRWRVSVNGALWPLSMFVKARPYSIEPFDPADNWNGRRIWMIRAGGYGDLIMMTPAIMEILEKWPNCSIIFAASTKYYEVLRNLDERISLYDLPINERDIDILDGIVSYEEWVEGHPMANTTHLADHFASPFGVSLKSRVPIYKITDYEKKLAFDIAPPRNLPRVGVQFEASATIRSYPYMCDVIERLIKDGCEVYLFGEESSLSIDIIETEVDKLINLTEKNLSFRESAAVLDTCDVVIAPDSAMVHLASALGKPCIGLYGPFDAGIRGSSPKFHGIQGKAPCAPCFYHAMHPLQFPKGMPCEREQRCIAMESIMPEEIHQKTMEILSQKS